MKTKDVNVSFTKAAIKKHIGLEEDVNSFKLEIAGVTFIEDGEIRGYNKVYDGHHDGWVICPRAKYTVVVKYGTNKTEFEFTDSLHAFQNREKPCFGTMLRCFLDDASMFESLVDPDEWQGVENLMSKFGYEDMKKARDVYRALFTNHNKVRSLGVSDDELEHQLSVGLEEYA